VEPSGGRGRSFGKRDLRATSEEGIEMTGPTKARMKVRSDTQFPAGIHIWIIIHGKGLSESGVCPNSLSD